MAVEIWLDPIWLCYENLQERNMPKSTLPAGLTVRTYKDGDEAHWLNIVKKAFGDVMAEWTPEMFLDRFVHQPQFKRDGFFLIKHGSEYVASVFAWEEDPGSPVGRLHYLSVIPAYQRQGLGTALCYLILEYFKEQGKSSVRLRTERFRDYAVRLYKSVGFKLVSK